MKKVKIIIAITIVFIMIMALVSCNKSTEENYLDGAIPVLSNYPNLSYLLVGEYDILKYGDGTWARNGYSTYVTEVNGKLAVMPSHVHESSSAPYVYQDMVYSFENVKGDKEGIYLDNRMVVTKKCVGMVHSYSKEKLLVFTTADGNGTIHLFEKKEGDTGLALSEQMIFIDGEIYLIYFDWENMNSDAPKEIYVITSKGVVVLKMNSFLNTSDESFSSIENVAIEAPEWWQYIRPTSATKTDDGTVFVGEREGVIGISSDGTIQYYPIDYTIAICGDEK